MNDRLTRAKASRSVAVKANLNHPVIDTDIHTIEFGPLLEEYIAQYGGAKIVDEFRAGVARGFNANFAEWYALTPQQRQEKRVFRPPFWALPAENTYDLATVSLPRLLYQRLEEQGTDYGVIYPNLTLFSIQTWRDELRRAVSRALNHYHADLYRPYADRLTPVAAIPLHTPQEGIEELEFAVKTLGLKTAIIPGGVTRLVKPVAQKYPPQHHPEVARFASYVDFLGIDSEYDYDPFWAKAVELGVPLTTHTGSQGWTGRASPSNYMNNHIGHFSDASEAFAKALFFGGVTRRFPQLRVGLLEGNGAWGSNTYVHLVDRFLKRGKDALQQYDPAKVDDEFLYNLYQEFGADLFKGKEYSREQILATSYGVITGARTQQQDPETIDDFAAAGIEKVEDIHERFVKNFYFGVESDDRTVRASFDEKVNFGHKLNAFWSSDSGHWDVPEITDTLYESWQLVEDGLLSEQDFRAFVYENPRRFYSEANPAFFKGTAIEEKPTQQKAP
jgi:predicted TIM-barrel fold metal-dependent hydrolase